MELDFITNNAIIYVLIVWVGIIVAAKALKLQNHGFEIKPYSLVYKNTQVYDILIRILGRTKRGIRVLADVSVVAGFLMMGFAFWFLINNITNFFLVPTEFSELTVLIPGVTLTSASAIAYFLLSLPIVLIVHEGAHGIVAALEKIKIKTGGFAVFIAVFAGFVEPDEEEFDKAKRISKLRVIGAGATANVIFALALGVILLTNPLFAIVLPEPILGTFYDVTNGVTVLSVIEGSGAESAGILTNDIIIGIDDYTIRTPIDMQKIDLIPGDTNTISVLRGEDTLQIPVEIISAPDDPDRGIVGIMRDGSLAFTPVFDYITWDNHHLSLFLLWLWMISFFIGIINMLPLPILDGGKFVYSIIEKKMSDGMLKGVMFGIYAFTFLIFGLNIALSYIKSGWFTI
ncbi:MAG: site-2 protease family protein [Candidatus Nitrosoabyssus spongiisocia]|nr:MAG: site-2 protease family protein [Nitrosopumilaceae archaeon AB1(1)]